MYRFYWDTCCVRAPVFSEIEASGADVDGPLDIDQYQEEINGATFGVYQLRYSVTPRQQGILQIPIITMTGEVMGQSDVFSNQTYSVITKGNWRTNYQATLSQQISKVHFQEQAAPVN